MTGRIGPPSHSMRPTAPKPKGTAPTSEEMSNYLKSCEEGREWGVKAFLHEWPNQLEVHWTGSMLTGLLCAAKWGHADIVAYLLEKGADLHATDKSGANILMLAAESGNEKLVETLLAKKFPVDAKDKEGRTALHHYVFGGDNDRDSGIPALLVKHGADINVSSPAGVKPLQWALTLGRKMIFRALLNLGADFSDPQLAVAAGLIDTDFTRMLEEEPANRGRAAAEKVEQGLDTTIRIKKPFNISTTRVEKKPPQHQAQTATSGRGFSL